MAKEIPSQTHVGFAVVYAVVLAMAIIASWPAVAGVAGTLVVVKLVRAAVVSQNEKKEVA